MKSLVRLWTVMAEDLAIGCCISTLRDSQTVAKRVEKEGVSFLTITLPSFCQDFERSLAEGCVGSAAFVGFKRRGGLPLFLGGFLSTIFDPDGLLLDVPNVHSIFAIRQLTAVAKKMELECAPKRVKAALRRYVECEQEVGAWSCTAERESSFTRMATLLFGPVLSRVDRNIYEGSVVPKHGPGATADRLTGNRKYRLREWTTRLETLFPFLDFALPSARYYKEQDHVKFLEPEAERPVRVITVPKTLKTPRIIAIEPTCMQYMQQAVFESFVQELEGTSHDSVSEQIACGKKFSLEDLLLREDEFLKSEIDIVGITSPVGGRKRANVGDHFASYLIGFAQQHPNRVLACMGSHYGNLATLDLSEASDRVSNRHVELLLARFPWFLRATQVTRSTKADVDGYGIMPLAKFASMGSALCFPIEAMVFTTVVMLGIESALNRPITLRDLKTLVGNVRVYGDDIVVPVDYVHSVMRELEAFGFRVNSNKSFWTGKFRESCGGDYYDGVDVTPIRLKHALPMSRRDVSAVVSTVAFRNHMYKRGMWRTAAFLDNQIERVLPHFPIVEDTSAALGRFTFLPVGSAYAPYQRVGGHLQKPLVRAYVGRTVIRKSKLDGLPALQKYFLKRGHEPFARDHLERTGRPETVDIKLRWVSQA